MILEEFDVDKYERSLKAEGIEYGQQIERERLNKLTCLLLEQNRLSDLKQATQDAEYQEALLREFGLYEDLEKIHKNIDN